MGLVVSNYLITQKLIECYNGFECKICKKIYNQNDFKYNNNFTKVYRENVCSKCKYMELMDKDPISNIT